MIPVLTPEEAAAVDARAADPVESLMERAGLAVALQAAQMGAGYGARVAVLAGPGNNGGDGYVAARYLAARGAAVEVLALAPAKSPAAERAARAAARARVPIRGWAPPGPVDLVVDALFGVGFRGSLPEEVVPWTRQEAPLLAVDVPSGLDAGTGLADGPAFRADRTVTFHALKVGHLVGDGPDRCGAVTVVDIGLEGGTPDLRLCEDGDAPRPPRRRTTHKWSAGSVMVVGGSSGMTGAALLAARAALNGGAGACLVACPGGLQGWFASMSPGLLTLGIGTGDRFSARDAGAVLAAADRYDVMVLGPGLGPDGEGLVRAVLRGRDGPVVLDADGLNAVDPPALAGRSGPAVLTPHAGELRRLTGGEADHGSAARLAEDTGTVVLLKGNPTFVCGEERWVVTSGGPELATIGTGDVLAGFLAALWGRGLDPETAARSAAHWHGRAGAALAARRGVTAETLAEEVAAWAWEGRR